MSDWPTWYLATQIGHLDGYDDCQIEEHRHRLEREAEQAMALHEEQITQVLDEAADAWMTERARREEIRQRWIGLGWQDVRQREAPAVTPAEDS